MRTVAFAIATGLGCGYAPKAPGTAGSLAALAAAWLLGYWTDVAPVTFAALGVVLLLPAVWSAHAVAGHLGSEDPQVVVIDEVVGQWIALAGACGRDWPYWLGAFVLFRLFDVWKPPPVRQLERLRGGWGIVLDDVSAGVYAAVVLYLAGCFNR